MRLVILIVVAFILSGCTSRMWKYQYEEVTIDGIYVYQQRNALLVSADDKAFLFELEPEVIELMAESADIALSVSLHGFTVDSDNQVIGTLGLQAKQQPLNEQHKTTLIQAGFYKSFDSHFYSAYEQITGQLYELEGKLPFQQLDDEFTIKITVPDTPFKTLGKIVATPFTVVFDAVVIVPTLLITVPLVGRMGH